MIKRYSYTTDGGVNEDPDGDMVMYEDYKEMAEYADRLVEFGKLPCLPKDLENLREANLAFAMEVHRLRQELHRLELLNFTRKTGNVIQYQPTSIIHFGDSGKIPFMG